LNDATSPVVLDQAAAPKRRGPDAKVTAMLPCVAAYAGMRGTAMAAFGEGCRRNGHAFTSLDDPLRTHGQKR